MTEGDIILLINYLGALPQGTDAPRAGVKTKRYDEYRAILTNAQRNFIIDALRSAPASAMRSGGDDA